MIFLGMFNENSKFVMSIKIYVNLIGSGCLFIKI